MDPTISREKSAPPRSSHGSKDNSGGSVLVPQFALVMMLSTAFVWASVIIGTTSPLPQPASESEGVSAGVTALDSEDGATSAQEETPNEEDNTTPGDCTSLGATQVPECGASEDGSPTPMVPTPSGCFSNEDACTDSAALTISGSLTDTPVGPLFPPDPGGENAWVTVSVQLRQDPSGEMLWSTEREFPYDDMSFDLVGIPVAGPAWFRMEMAFESGEVYESCSEQQIELTYGQETEVAVSLCLVFSLDTISDQSAWWVTLELSQDLDRYVQNFYQPEYRARFYDCLLSDTDVTQELIREPINDGALLIWPPEKAVILPREDQCTMEVEFLNAGLLMMSGDMEIDVAVASGTESGTMYLTSVDYFLEGIYTPSSTLLRLDLTSLLPYLDVFGSTLAYQMTLIPTTGDPRRYMMTRVGSELQAHLVLNTDMGYDARLTVMSGSTWALGAIGKIDPSFYSNLSFLAQFGRSIAAPPSFRLRVSPKRGSSVVVHSH